MRAKRAHGRILSVETLTRGSALAEDAAAGATSITVVDAGDFEETDDDGPAPTAANPLGWLTVGSQVVAYLACDDDTGVIDLAEPLAAAGEEGDTVAVWSELYEEAIEYQQALVELDGRYDNPEPVEAEVHEGVAELPEGDRGKPGESCTLKRLSADEWEVVAVGGRGRQSQSIRFEQDDTYTLTAADITAGTATLSLSHRPIDEALTCYLAGVPQRPTNWTIDYDAQTLTQTLSGWEKAGYPLWVHYAYRKGITTTPVAAEMAYIGGTDTNVHDVVTEMPLPVGTQAGDLIIAYAFTSTWDVQTENDPRMTQYWKNGNGDSVIWAGIEDGSGLPVKVGYNMGGGNVGASLVLAVFRGVTGVVSRTMVTGSTTPGAIPSVTGRAVVAISGAYAGTFGTAGVGVPTGYTNSAASADDKCASRICHWFSPDGTPQASPEGTQNFVQTESWVTHLLEVR